MFDDRMPWKLDSDSISMYSASSLSQRTFIIRKRHLSRSLASLLALACFFPCALPAAPENASGLPQLSRIASSGQFVSAVGRRAALLGNKEGQFEAWIYPLKIFRGLHIRFHIDGRILAAEPLARTVITRPESSTILYSDSSFRVRETLFVPVNEPGAVVTFEVQTERPLEIEVVFTPDFQLEWPANLGPSHLAWDSKQRRFLLSAENHAYAAIVGSPTASDAHIKDESKDDSSGSSSQESSFLLGVTQRGTQTKFLCIAASLQGRDNAVKIYDGLIRGQKGLMEEATNYYRDYLSRTLNVNVPDAEMQQAYDWARINLLQAVVDNPLVGTSLIAGYGPSGDAERPGFDWFFGRDALWSSVALDAEGDLTDAKTALEFLAKYQRADGKIPHEVPQSASLVRWFEDYPYGYASADATPLFLMAMWDYVERSGDLAFARQKWESTWRAYQFLNSTLDADGLAKNLDVGHGWVESGPLVPVRTEIYQASLGIEALRAMSALAARFGKSDIATSLDETFHRQRTRLNDLFWSSDKKIFAFAIDPNNARMDETTVLPAVPMWFGLLDTTKAGEMITRLAAPDMQTDWGMRILSSSSAKYAGDGYHFGAVWPLFTGWASMGEYRYHRELAAYLNLRANALLALDGSPGHVTEVLNGDQYEPLPTSTPQQTWSAAMIVSPLLEGLFGLATNATDGAVALKPHVPADWDSFTLSNLHIGSMTLSFRFHKDAGGIWLEIRRAGSGKCVLDFSPALSFRAHIESATLNGRTIPYRIESNDEDQHASVRFEVPAGKSTLRMRISDDFGLALASQLPAEGRPSRGLRILSTSWTPERDGLSLDVAGVPSSTYEFRLSNSSQIVSVEGADLHRTQRGAAKLRVRFDAGPETYIQRQIKLRFATALQKKMSARPISTRP
jgi:glycogen debranching enzyme